MISLTNITASFAAMGWQHGHISIEIGTCVIDGGQKTVVFAG
jgi:hypothetical protein